MCVSVATNTTHFNFFFFLQTVLWPMRCLLNTHRKILWPAEGNKARGLTKYLKHKNQNKAICQLDADKTKSFSSLNKKTEFFNFKTIY